jgi:hypothetical protein
MKYLLLVCAFIALVTANVDFASWHAPVHGAARSPCPALSMLPVQGNKSHKLITIQTP